jgi:hypothetical protein
MPIKKKPEELPLAEEAQPTPVVVTEEESRAEAPSSTEPALVISSIDRSVVNTEGPLLTRDQVNNLRRKLKAKFH